MFNYKGGISQMCYLLIFPVVLAQDSHQSTSTGQPSTDEKGWLSVVGASYVRPNSDYECAVTLSPESSSATDVTVAVTEEEGDDIFTNVFSNQTITIQPSSTQTVKLEIGDLPPGLFRCYLKVTSKGAHTFSKSEKLQVITKRATLLIQTDRAVYKPGALVHIRILVLDPQLRPNIHSPLQIHIIDGEGNRLKEWRDEKSQGGVWSGQLQLSENPVLGDWDIHVSVHDENAQKQFQVAEYVLPKFEVSVSVTPHWLKRNTVIPVKILAKYTHGGGVLGEATVRAFQRGNVEVNVVPINGETTVEFDLKQLNVDERSNQLSFDVTVQEKATGKEMNCSATVELHNLPVLMEFIEPSKGFVPGRKLSSYMKVTQYDGTPLSGNEGSEVNLTFFSSTFLHNGEDGTKFEEFTSKIDRGLVKITVTPPNDCRTLLIKGSYGESEGSWRLTSFYSSENKMFLNLMTQRVKVNSQVELEVNVHDNIPKVHYVVIGRRGLVLAGSLEVLDKDSTIDLKFEVTSSMAPSSDLVVYYVKDNSKVVSNSVKLTPQMVLDNFVELESNSSVAEPGQSVALSIKTKPNSLVGLLAVDQSSLLLKKGNDITMSSVIEDLEVYLAPLNRDIWSADKTKKIFKKAGAVLLTNFEPEDNLHVYYRRYYGFGRPGDTAYPFLMPRLFGPSFVNDGLHVVDDYDSNMSYYDSPQVSMPKPKLRSKFPETWIWRHIHTNEEGNAVINETLPDTITSWVISGFSVNSEQGLGLIQQPTNIRVFRPFFITVDLPYSIIRGETVSIPALVFNYMDTPLTADVSLLNDAGQFEFGDTTDSVSNNPEEKTLSRKERVTVQPNSVGKTSFTITPTELGYIGIKVSALCDVAADLIERKLLVKAEGETLYNNVALFIDLRTEDSHEESVSINVPDLFVPGSSYVEVSAIGNILGTSMQNLDKLIRMPYGCGEQNMLKFVPNILVLDYFKNSGEKMPDGLEARCLKYMEVGYQQELTYKHPDGSYSAFGKSDKSGSTWLTAFVLKSFISAMPYMDIDKDVMRSGFSWLASKQAPDGSFKEEGRMLDKEMQGGSGSGVALTSFALLPFLMYKDQSFTSTIEKGLAFIENQLDSIKNDTYSLAISTYTLHLADSSLKHQAFDMLIENANKTRTKMWWKRAAKETDSVNPFASMPNSVDVEMTCYALLSYLERNQVEDTMPIINWLLSQQNSNGGFASTQDTVVALTALSKLAAKISTKDSDITINFSTDKGFSKELQVNSDNGLVLQTVKIEGDAEEVDVKASGRGIAIVQVSHRYNVNEKGAWPMFQITPKTYIPYADENHLHLQICSKFMAGAEGDGDEMSNMVVMEINLPSGYVVDQDSVSSLQNTDSVMRTELKDSDTHIDLYFNEMSKDLVCPEVVALRSHQVENNKAVAITLYDYYDQSRRARVFYSLPAPTRSNVF